MAVREKPYRCRRHAEGISGQRREKTERIHPAESREPLIEAEAVSLSYDGGEPLLNDIHFKIEPVKPCIVSWEPTDAERVR